MRITEVAKRFSITTQTLRYWERIGLLTNVKKDASGYRNYDDDNLEQLKFVTCMRNNGMSIAALQNYLALFKQGPATLGKRKKIIRDQIYNIDHQIDSLNEAKQMLSYKLEHYDELFGK
ncbi:MerR family transcriptional regulator [Lactobacillus sp. Sy-1]|uniref:MerR family transcriptional regulator n=1 Tax=Lactobacillus sp. Sy-1 TaxID=2109645 RepID=UPI001C59DCE5|nr:MerR family transcriptional regulator [Lactobacillus sp. Sy-1]MBW1605030.1 MerR family transcriptional regulator [Lactobacillus sp. Sy-1]